MRNKIFIFLALIILVGAGFLIIDREQAEAPSHQPDMSTSPQTDSNLSNDEASKYTIDNPNSIYYIVNKQRALPEGFTPQNLVTVGGEQIRSDTATTMSSLLSAAKKEGINLRLISGYRSYNDQQRVYSGYVRSDGQTKADTYSARPGHSEHQTGLAIDLGSGGCDLQTCFGDSRGGKWLAEHAHEYGFIIRYGKSQENLTGYQYEPWHLRYVGSELAGKLHESGQTMEQFFGLPAPTGY